MKPAAAARVWSVGPDGTAKELGEVFGIEMDSNTEEKQSGGRTIIPEDVRRLLEERAGGAITPERRRAWEWVVKHGVPPPGRPSKASREAGRPTLKELGLTKQDMWRIRQTGSIPEAEWERRSAAQKRYSFEGLIGRRRPRRKAERLIDDLRRSLPYFRPEEVQRLLAVLADLLEEK